MDEMHELLADDSVARVRDLLSVLESGDVAAAKEIIDDLAAIREKDIYQELGKLTRELHESINNFTMDDRITNLAEEEIPDARARLNHVITMTDDAANSTLEAVEKSIPICDDLETKANSLLDNWNKFRNRELTLKEFKELSASINGYCEENSAGFNVIRNQLNQVLMAQGFQDLTSQIIKKVILLVEEVEISMVNIIKLTGHTSDKDVTSEKDAGLAGPVVPGVEVADTVAGQDEVDDLLSSLGF